MLTTHILLSTYKRYIIYISYVHPDQIFDDTQSTAKQFHDSSAVKKSLNLFTEKFTFATNRELFGKNKKFENESR